MAVMMERWLVTGYFRLEDGMPCPNALVVITLEYVGRGGLKGYAVGNGVTQGNGAYGVAVDIPTGTQPGSVRASVFNEDQFTGTIVGIDEQYEQSGWAFEAAGELEWVEIANGVVANFPVGLACGRPFPTLGMPTGGPRPGGRAKKAVRVTGADQVVVVILSANVSKRTRDVRGRVSLDGGDPLALEGDYDNVSDLCALTGKSASVPVTLSAGSHTVELVVDTPMGFLPGHQSGDLISSRAQVQLELLFADPVNVAVVIPPVRGGSRHPNAYEIQQAIGPASVPTMNAKGVSLSDLFAAGPVTHNSYTLHGILISGTTQARLAGYTLTLTATGYYIGALGKTKSDDHSSDVVTDENGEWSVQFFGQFWWYQEYLTAFKVQKILKADGVNLVRSFNGGDKVFNSRDDGSMAPNQSYEVKTIVVIS